MVECWSDATTTYAQDNLRFLISSLIFSNRSGSGLPSDASFAPSPAPGNPSNSSPFSSLAGAGLPCVLREMTRKVVRSKRTTSAAEQIRANWVRCRSSVATLGISVCTMADQACEEKRREERQ